MTQVPRQQQRQQQNGSAISNMISCFESSGQCNNMKNRLYADDYEIIMYLLLFIIYYYPESMYTSMSMSINDRA